MKNIQTHQNSYRVEAVIKGMFVTYLATTEVTISQAHVTFEGVNVQTMQEGLYPEPRKIVVSTPYSVEFT